MVIGTLLCHGLRFCVSPTQRAFIRLTVTRCVVLGDFGRREIIYRAVWRVGEISGNGKAGFESAPNDLNFELVTSEFGQGLTGISSIFQVLRLRLRIYH